MPLVDITVLFAKIANQMHREQAEIRKATQSFWSQFLFSLLIDILFERNNSPV